MFTKQNHVRYGIQIRIDGYPIFTYKARICSCSTCANFLSNVLHDKVLKLAEGSDDQFDIGC